MPPAAAGVAPPPGGVKNATALRDVCILLCVYALWEFSAWLTKRRLLRAHPKKRGVPLAAGQGWRAGK
jgi:hypothetical protein